MKEKTQALKLKIDVAQERLEVITKKAAELPPEQRQIMGEALEELSCALEELHVLSEELREQNEVLARSGQLVENARKHYRELFEFAPDGYLVTDAAGVIEEANRAAADLLAVRQEHLVGKPVSVYVSQKDQISFYAALKTMVGGATDQSYEMELPLRSRKGRTFPALIKIGAVLVEDGKLGLRWLFRDITYSKQYEESLRQTRELANKNAELEQYVSIAAHDLREPARVIVTYSTLLSERLQGKSDSESETYLSFAQQAARNIMSRIEDLLTYSSAGKDTEELEMVDTASVLAEALINLNLTLKESRAEIVSGDLPLVLGSRSQMLQLFENLIGNAAKFSKGPASVHISAEKHGSEWIFSVKDNGIGIDMQYADRIFGMFQRLHKVDEYPGNGIGLAICKKIIGRHHGRIWVESKPGMGSTFYFAIPDGEQKQTVDKSKRQHKH